MVSLWGSTDLTHEVAFSLMKWMKWDPTRQLALLAYNPNSTTAIFINDFLDNWEEPDTLLVTLVNILVLMVEFIKVDIIELPWMNMKV